MNKIKVYALYFLLIGANELFAKPAVTGVATDKLNETNDELSGAFAVTVMTLSLIAAGLGWIFNFLSKQWIFGILGGGLVVSGAGTIAEWWIG